MAQPFPNELKHLYDNTEFIGSGGFARVFKARRKDGRVVAVKIPLSLDEATGKSFLREITSWQRLSHKNIVSLFDANILPIPYLEQEYCDGWSLESLKKPLEITKACEIVFDIAEGLNYAHKQGIVHRDLKPQNILLTKDNVPKITDWGMSRVIAESRSSTQHGYTPAYASPEQVSPKKFGKPDERTDIYQLGVIFYNLLTGELPFKGDDIVEISSAIVNEKPIAPSELNPETKKVEHIVRKCLSKNKEGRYQSVEELQKELSKFVKKPEEKLQQETVRREKKKEKELKEAQEERMLREQERIAKEKEEPKAQKEGTSWKGIFAVALVLGALLLGIWALAPGATEAPGTTKSTPSPTPKVTPTVIQTSMITPTVSSLSTIQTPTAKDDFESGNLNTWTQETLVTWATESFDHGIVDDGGNKVAFIKGGIDNGGGGGQVLVRNDLNSNDASIQSRIKMILDPNHVNYFPDSEVRAGITGRYQSIGKGYGTYIEYDLQNSKVSLFVIRMDGTQPGPNYAYNTKYVYLKDPVVLSNFDPLQWHTIQMDLQGSSITVRLDGQVKIQATDSTYAGGSPGLLFWGGDGTGYTYYDDFIVIDQSTNSQVVTTPAEGQKTFTNSIGMEFVLIPAGEFDMGSPDSEKGRYADEGPIHHVKIAKAFYMGKYEVTQKQWREIMGYNPSKFQGDNLPVDTMSWADVLEFIGKLNAKEGTNKYRLPTEAEWEYAARTGTKTIYSFGDNESMLGDYAWFIKNSNDRTHAVGKKMPNAWELYDMYGNVWEWVQDVYHNSYSGAPTDGSAWEGDGFDSIYGDERIYRGGGWYCSIENCRSAFRGHLSSKSRFDALGFRLLRIT
jgi:formylglycine-generating enzyme required for sulfatase activity/serine/threonine protein kinase